MKDWIKKLKSHVRKYCSRKCNKQFNTKTIFQRIESGDSTVSSKMCKVYLIEQRGNKCEECGWSKTNVVTGNVPIELEHVDGNSENNNINNLKLLCPNCHSLTPTYKSLNIGNGRFKRKQRYKAGLSF